MNITLAKLRTEPATDYEIHLMLKHRESGTSPGNPKWYKSAKIVPRKVESNKVQYPGYVKALFTKQNPVVLEIPSSDITDITVYIAEFERLNMLKGG